MKKIILILIFALPSLTLAQSVETLIQKRQDTFSDIETVIEKADDLIDGSDTNWAELSEASQVLVNHGDTLKVSFPSGSQHDSKAKSAIWEKPKKFNSLLNQMNTGFENLYFASKKQDIEMAEMGLEQAEDTCRSCHRSYRSLW